MGSEPEVAVDRSEKKKLARRVENLILVQANPFIRNLLASLGSPMGVTKDHFRGYLDTLIGSGKLTLRAVDDWLDEVEGWGNQRIMLWNVPREVSRETFSRTVDEVNAMVDARLGERVWGISPTELRFPPQMTLTGAEFDESSLRMVWWKGYESWKRAPELDHLGPVEAAEEWFREEKGIEVWLKASRKIRQREVMRFEVRRIDGRSCLAVLFVPGRLTGPEREAAITQAREETERLGLFRFDDLEPIEVAKIIKYLDQAELETDGAAEKDVLTHTTRLAKSGAYVEFSSYDSGHTYIESPMVRDVRDAVTDLKLRRFLGDNGLLEWDVVDQPNVRSRQVGVWLWGRENAIEIRAQLSAEQVSNIINTLRRYQRRRPVLKAAAKAAARAAA